MQQPLVLVVGPTASGKTGLAIALAQHFNTAIIAADSRQFYREIPIGTAQPTPQEQQGVLHHFIGNLELDETWSAARFSAAVDQLITEKEFAPFPIVVGGSGLYLKALEYTLDAIPTVPHATREALQNTLEQEGLPAMHDELKEKDPDYAEKVDLNNPQRVVRALEVIRHTGKTFSSFLTGGRPREDRKVIKLAIDWPREALYKRINMRVDTMFEEGLLEEAKKVYAKRGLNSLNTVGFKELFAHFDGDMSLEEAKELIKRNTRRFAKRQLTWFRSDRQIHWIRPGETKSAIQHIKAWMETV